MNTDQKSIERIAAANARVTAWREGRYDELPTGYTHESIQFDVDLRVMEKATEFACAVSWLMAEKL
jgi:hypothetical protein